MNIDTLVRRLNLESEAVIIGIVLLAILLILFVNRKRLQLRLREWRIQRQLDQIGSAQLRHLQCPDGLDGHYQLDRVALVGDAILLISYKPYSGIIYCAERIAEWTQVLEQKSFKFENPLFEIENQLTSLALVTGAAPLKGILIFNQSAVFPKGRPHNVLQPDSIPAAYLAPNCMPPKAETRRAWEQLKALQQVASGNRRLGVKT